MTKNEILTQNIQECMRRSKEFQDKGDLLVSLYYDNAAKGFAVKRAFMSLYEAEKIWV